jgi:HNH endonuclease
LGHGRGGWRKGDGMSKDKGSGPFGFEMFTRRSKIPDEKIIASLRAFSRKRRGALFSQVEYNAWRGRVAHSGVISKRFGNWWKALTEAGVKTGRRQRWGTEEIVEFVERVWRELGHRPAARELVSAGGPSSAAISARWGTHLKLCKLMVDYKAGRITRSQLLLTGVRTRAARVRTGLRGGVRWEVLKRDGFRCTACGCAGEAGNKLHVDHIVPVSRGGGNEMSNLRTLCAACNAGRGAGRRDGAVGEGEVGARAA